jgi:hypothetical protein
MLLIEERTVTVRLKTTVKEEDDIFFELHQYVEVDFYCASTGI